MSKFTIDLKGLRTKVHRLSNLVVALEQQSQPQDPTNLLDLGKEATRLRGRIKTAICQAQSKICGLRVAYCNGIF